MRKMDPDTGFDGGPNSFAALAGAIPRNTLRTMLRICCYGTLKTKTTKSAHSISGLSVSDNNFVGIHLHDVPPSSPQTNLFDFEVVLKLKYKADGTPDKHKRRLVARGFESKPGVDFFGTFAPSVFTER